jgi:hypothetical protein
MEPKEIKERAKKLGLKEDATQEQVIEKEKDLGIRDTEGKLLTREAFDGLYKKGKIVEDKLKVAEEGKVEAIGRVATLEKENERLRKTTVPPSKPVKGITPLVEVFNERNYPQTKEEWDDLHDEDPLYCTDLRQSYNNRRQSSADERAESARKIQEANKDMFKVDEAGNLILDETGRPQVDEKTEKGKIFLEVCGDDPRLLDVRGGLEKVMEITLGRLGKSKEKKTLEQLNEEKRIAEEKRKKDVKGGAVVSGGNPPPPPPKVEVTFNSKEEEAYVERKIASGVYKDKEHYCRVRDNKEVGYGRGGF